MRFDFYKTEREAAEVLECGLKASKRDEAGKFFLKVWKPKAEKPYINYYFKTAEQRDAHLAQAVSGFEKHLEFKAANKAARNGNRITMATLKAFAKKNADNLYVKVESSFDGMTDCIEHNKDAKFSKTKIDSTNDFYATGIIGVYTVGGSRDWFSRYEDEKFVGIKICNSCGSSILVTKK